jgi:hypothetical protein
MSISPSTKIRLQAAWGLAVILSLVLLVTADLTLPGDTIPFPYFIPLILTVGLPVAAFAVFAVFVLIWGILYALVKGETP